MDINDNRANLSQKNRIKWPEWKNSEQKFQRGNSSSSNQKLNETSNKKERYVPTRNPFGSKWFCFPHFRCIIIIIIIFAEKDIIRDSSFCVFASHKYNTIFHFNTTLAETRSYHTSRYDHDVLVHGWWVIASVNLVWVAHWKGHRIFVDLLNDMIRVYRVGLLMGVVGC